MVHSMILVFAAMPLIGCRAGIRLRSGVPVRIYVAERVTSRHVSMLKQRSRKFRLGPVSS